MCIPAGSKKVFHLKAGFVFMCKYAPIGGMQSAEIMIMKKSKECPGKQTAPDTPALPMNKWGSPGVNNNLLLFLGERIDDLVHDRLAAVLKPEPDDDRNCGAKTDADTPCDRCHKRVDNGEIKLQL